MTVNLQVSDDDASERLDVYLADQLKDYSRARIQKLIGTHAVKINDQSVKSNYRIHAGDNVTVEEPQPRVSGRALPEDIELNIVFEDSDIVVVNKQKGLVVHPAPGAETGTLVNALLAHCGDLSGIGGELRPGIVHRLDKDTSGLIVVAKNDFAHEGLSKQIQGRTAVRKYNALLWGRLPFKHAVIDAPLARHPSDRKRMSVWEDGSVHGHAPVEDRPANVRDAVTELRLLEHIGEFSWAEAILQTGRTHQIRVHCSFAGYPVVGDAAYGGLRKVSAEILRGAPLQTLNAKIASLHGQALHAHSLSFDHPRTNKRMQFHATLPDEVVELLDMLRRLNEQDPKK